MGSFIYPVLVAAMLMGIFTLERNQSPASLPTSSQVQAASDSQQFLEYRSAVAVYQAQHPTHTGTVASSSLTAEGYQFSGDFLARAGNAVSAAGAARIVTCYANLAPGALATALNVSDNDASLGMASGGSWLSYAQGVNRTAQPLATPVPNGDVVSVIEVGG